MVDTSTEAVENLLDGVTQVDWFSDSYRVEDFIPAARDLVPALLAERDALRAKLDAAVDALDAWMDLAANCNIEEGVCCCGDNMENHGDPMNCGHSPTDHGSYIARMLFQTTIATIAKIKGNDK